MSQSAEHEVAHAGIDHCLPRLELLLVVLAHTAQSPPPGKRPLNNPAVRLDREGILGLRVGACDDLHLPAHALAQLLHQRAAVARIGPDPPETGQRRPLEVQRLRHQPRPVAIVRSGGRHHDFEGEALGVHEQVALAPHHPLVGIVAAWAPF